MKKVLIALTLLLSASFTYAQQKIGYIDAEELITMMPEAQKADAEIKTFAKTYQDRLATLQKEFETKYKAYEDAMKAKSLTEPMKDVKEQELQTLQTSIQTTQQSAEEKVAAKRQELLKPITEKADKAISDVAKSKGYTFIFDSSNSGLYMPLRIISWLMLRRPLVLKILRHQTGYRRNRHKTEKLRI